MSLNDNKIILKRGTGKPSSLELGELAIDETSGDIYAGGTAGVDVIRGSVPVGSIIIWGGLIAEMPDGWALCDGSGVTLDFRDKFIYGTTFTAEIGNTGGNNDATNVKHTHDLQHGHPGATTNSAGAHSHTYARYYTKSRDARSGDKSRLNNSDQYNTQITGVAGDHTHSLSGVSYTGNSGATTGNRTNMNMPKYIKVGFIQRIF